MFYSTTKKIVSEIDPGSLTLFPVKSPLDSPKCKPLHLVIKKKKKIFSKRENYAPTPFRLTDILIDGQDLDFGLSSSIIACFSESSSASLSAQVCVDSGHVDVGAHISGSSSDAMSSVEMRKHTISERTLLDVTKDRKVNREHRFVKQMKNNTVYVILEVIETEHACSVNNSSKAETGMKVLMKLLKMEADLSVRRERKLTFPARTSIAYKVSELMISPNDNLELNWDLCFQGPDMSRFDQKPRLAASLAELTKMCADKKILFLNAILEILEHSDSFAVLDEMLDPIMEDLQPDFQVLDQTEEDNRACVEKMLDLLGIKKEGPPGEPLALTPESEGIIRAINILIQSLSEMDPETLILLASCVKAEIISKQLKLVTIIDDKWSGAPQYQRDLLEDEEDPEKVLINQLTDEEFEITQQVLEEFGFQLDRESASVLRIKNRKQGDVLSLFAALYALNALCD
ncbi:pejvakin-like isoform X2 [Amblyraja radiata]|uniref:pejvakin-like isoform X2 n=1 Tax=Amblyraja radiata TaxID=386614 RepID=UPI0014025A00|nr:pejvakin-like isoform X2 [Amblyraja radiata]